MPSDVVAAVEIVSTPTFTLREFFGNVATKDSTLSAVHEKTTEQMSMPWRCPEFTEYILVIAGEIQVDHNGGTVVVPAGSGIFLPAGCRIRVRISGPSEFVAICTPAFSPATEHPEAEGTEPSAPAHATESVPVLFAAVDVVKAPALTITEHFGNVASKDSNLSACVANVGEPCSEAWQQPEFAEWVLVLSGCLHLEHADGTTKVPAGSGVFLAANERVKWVWPETCVYVPICMPAFTPDGCRREPEEGSAKDVDPQTMAHLHELHTAKPAMKKAKTERTFLFSSESVNEGHPDKLCDQVSDAVLDACLTADPKSKVACETATKDNMVMVAGEITTQAKLDYEKIVRGVVLGIGFDSFVDDLSSVDSKGLSDKTCEVIVRINKQSPDIAGGVHVGKDDMDVGAGDQGIMFGYASDETEDCMPLTHSMATRLGKKLTDVRKSGNLWWLRPDGKTQVTIEYLQKDDGSVEPQKIHTVVISTQHAEPSKAVRSKECAGYAGPEMTAPSMEEMNKLIVEEVVKETLKEITLKNGKQALTLYGDHTHLHINPSGKFIIGGPQGDAGLTGRKIIIDTYGGWGAHGGGAFSGKDPTKVDRSAAYICRQMAKSVVKSGLCKRALVQLSYAIGVAKPLSLFVETYGTEQGALTADDITNVIKMEFDCRPGAIALSLALREPKYQETAAYCHFGRMPVTKDGIKFFEWENAKDVSKYASMTSAEVTTALKASNYLTKWVD